MNSHRRFSMGVTSMIFRDQVGVEHACLGIDIQAARPAPAGKRFGIDVSAHDDMPVAASLLESHANSIHIRGRRLAEMVGKDYVQATKKYRP